MEGDPERRAQRRQHHAHQHHFRRLLQLAEGGLQQHQHPRATRRHDRYGQRARSRHGARVQHLGRLQQRHVVT